MAYIKRHYQQLVEEYLGYFPVVAIIGPRQCGKITLTEHLGNGWKHFDLERGRISI